MNLQESLQERTIRAVIVGCGGIAHAHAGSAMLHPDKITLVGCADVIEEISGYGTPLNRLVAPYYGMLSSSPAPSLIECLKTPSDVKPDLEKLKDWGARQ
jgi:hypothetical protein